MAKDIEPLSYKGIFTAEEINLLLRWSYKFAKATRMPPDDLRQELSVKLWKCQEAYQPGQLMPLDHERVIKAALYRRILDLIRAQTREKRQQESKNLSLNYENEEGEEYLTETTPDPEATQIQKNLEFHKTLEVAVGSFDEEENQIFDLLMKDISKTAIAEQIGLSRDTVYERIKSIQHGFPIY